jgi:hypothetical protein
MTYEWLLMQLRLLADANKDKRSLVAIAAKFERDVDDLDVPDYLKDSIKRTSHIRHSLNKAA